jgi:tryptophanyl-tRNA synthetase
VVPGTDGQKMSKSYSNTIDPLRRRQALKEVSWAIVTDSTPVEAPKDPEKSNVFALLKLFLPAEELRAVEESYRKGGTGTASTRRCCSPPSTPASDAARPGAWSWRRTRRRWRTAARRRPRARALAEPLMDEVRRAVGLPARW